MHQIGRDHQHAAGSQTEHLVLDVVVAHAGGDVSDLLIGMLVGPGLMVGLQLVHGEGSALAGEGLAAHAGAHLGQGRSAQLAQL